MSSPRIFNPFYKSIDYSIVFQVIDMGVVIEVLSQLECIPITKEVLEVKKTNLEYKISWFLGHFFHLQVSRLGKHVNELRRKASDKLLASRAKSLVKKWRQLLMPGGFPDGPSNFSHLTNGNSNGHSIQSKPICQALSQQGEKYSNGSASPCKDPIFVYFSV